MSGKKGTESVARKVRHAFGKMDQVCPNAKVVFIGDSSVGKTSIVVRHGTGALPVDTRPTVSANYTTRIYRTALGDLELRIWDTAGQEAYHSLAPVYFQNSSIAFVVFDITNRCSFSHVEKWIRMAREHGEENIVVVVLANKADLENERMVGSEEYSEIAEKLDAEVLETSAVTGAGLDEMFERAVSLLLERDQQLAFRLHMASLDGNKLQTKSDGCC